MNIVTAEKNKGRLLDGIDTILNLSEEDFNEVLDYMKPDRGRCVIFEFWYHSDKAENEAGEFQIGIERNIAKDGRTIGRYYFDGERFLPKDITQALLSIDKNSLDEEKKSRIDKLISCRDLKSIIASFSKDNEFNEKLYEILTDEETFKKFLDYDNNQNLFAVKSNLIDKNEYFEILASLFGRVENGQFIDTNSNDAQIKKYYIPDSENVIRRYEEITKKYNLERYINSRYISIATGPLYSDLIYRRFNSQEDAWKVNPSLREAVYADMLDDYTKEEKVFHIYAKLCEKLNYEDGYLYRDSIKQDRTYDHRLDISRIESIKPGDRVTCWDFARLFAKLANEVDPSIEALIGSQGMNEGHFYCGFYDENVSVKLEPINVSNGSNDLNNAKNHLELTGIEVVSDKDGIVPKALARVYNNLYQQKPKTIDEYMFELQNLPHDEIIFDLDKKLQAFLNTLEKKNIVGSDAFMTFKFYQKSGFFVENLNTALVGSKKEEDGKEKIERILLIRSLDKYREIGISAPLYMVDLYRHTVEEVDPKEIFDKLNNGELVYEDADEEKRHILGLEEETK